MDLIEIDAASNTSVEDVRDLRDKINFSPSQGTYKVYIIDEVHMLSTAAFNALLKTLEEPPPHAIFILATTENHKIPATVLSRCQRHEFRRVPLGEITRRLADICKAENIEADAEALTTIARQSSGGLRDAISLLDQLASTGGKITLETAQTVLGTATSQSVIALVQAVVAREPASGLEEIHRALDGGADARALARQVVEYLRNVMLIQMGNGEQVEVPADARAQMVAHAKALPTHEVLRMMRAFNAAASDPRGGWSPSLGIELAFAEMLEQPQVMQVEAGSAPKVVAKSQAASHPEPPPARSQMVTSQGPVTSAESAPQAATFEAVTKAWKQVAQLVKAKDTNVAALLNSGKPLEIREGILLVAFASDILQEKFNRPESLDLTRKALQEALGADLPVQGIVTGGKNALPAHVKPDGMVAAAIQNGGEIVDVQ
jgi:DNA polymerase-3 subunit gamma/tau